MKNKVFLLLSPIYGYEDCPHIRPQTAVVVPVAVVLVPQHTPARASVFQDELKGLKKRDHKITDV